MTDNNRLKVVTLDRRPSKGLIELKGLLQQMDSVGLARMSAIAETILYRSAMARGRLIIEADGISPKAVESLIAAGLMRDECLSKFLIRAREVAIEDPRFPKSSAEVIVLKSGKRKGFCTKAD